MKKAILILCVSLITVSSFSSCATIFGGPISACQRTRPLRDEPARLLRPAPLIIQAVFLWWVGLAIDFATGAIYQPCILVPKGKS